MAWIVLIVAGLLEAGWASLLPETKGFTRPLQSVAFLSLLVLSMIGLSYATRTLPIGAAYAVWVGIGAVGTVLLGIVIHGDHAPPAHLVALAALVGSIIAVKVTAAH